MSNFILPLLYLAIVQAGSSIAWAQTSIGKAVGNAASGAIKDQIFRNECLGRLNGKGKLTEGKDSEGNKTVTLTDGDSKVVLVAFREEDPDGHNITSCKQTRIVNGELTSEGITRTSEYTNRTAVDRSTGLTTETHINKDLQIRIIYETGPPEGKRQQSYKIGRGHWVTMGVTVSNDDKLKFLAGDAAYFENRYGFDKGSGGGANPAAASD